MIPVVTNATNLAPAPTTLVATPLPDSSSLRVPFNNVPPSVSSVQINNNARGNASYVAPGAPAPLSVPVAPQDASSGATVRASSSSAVPAQFLAQLIGQGVPPQLQGALSSVLATYDQLVANSFVKYRPSNATIPQPAPTGVFGKFLAEAQSSQPVAQPQPDVAFEQQQPVEQQRPSAPVVSREAAALQAAQAQAVQPKQPTTERPQAVESKPARPRVSTAKVALTYLFNDARIELQAPPLVKATA